jgi:xylulose-5-phosphate/fructose-6-phosphate phosphoketolase
MDRYALAHDALTRVADGSDRFADLLTALTDARAAAREFAYTNGEDHEAVAGWEFTGWPQDEPSDGGTGGDPGQGETEGAAPGR